MNKLLFDFTLAETVSAFHPIGDSVMGGVSTGMLNAGEGCAVFYGDVSFRNQGGFASVRSEPGEWDLAAFHGIELKIQGDGKTYKLSITTEPRYGSVVYRARFAPPQGKWTAVRIPFQEFSATFRGQKVPEAPPLDTSRINSFGFLISDRQEGNFRLEIRSIKAY